MFLRKQLSMATLLLVSCAAVSLTCGTGPRSVTAINDVGSPLRITGAVLSPDKLTETCTIRNMTNQPAKRYSVTTWNLDTTGTVISSWTVSRNDGIAAGQTVQFTISADRPVGQGVLVVGVSEVAMPSGTWTWASTDLERALRDTTQSR
ncbi:MAG: hypothetical protein HYX76_11590 [Acidobacteria bacterium]|nr:hypothetical protein [Acidobacteriota bacterium]